MPTPNTDVTQGVGNIDLLYAIQNLSGSTSALLNFQTGATAVGNGTAVDVSGYNTIVVQNIIQTTATVTYEVSQDATTWISIVGQKIDTVGSLASTNNASSQVRLNVSGSKWFRVRISSWTSGTVDSFGYASTVGNWYVPYTSTFGSADTSSSTQTLQGVGGYNLLYDGTNWVRQRSGTAVGDATTGTGFIANSLWCYNGTNFDRVRAGSKYYYQEYIGLATNTSTSVWTPASGKKFRLMGITISATVLGRYFIKDGLSGNVICAFNLEVANQQRDFYFGNGLISGTANNVLAVQNGNATTANVWCTSWGTEE